MSWGEVSIILIMLVESSSHIFPIANVGSLQLIEPFQLSPCQTFREEMDPQIPVSSVGLYLPDIRPQMKFGTKDPIIFSKDRDLEFVRDVHPRDHT